MHEEVFADGIGEITVNGSIVRIDLVSLSPSERDAKGQPKAVFRQRIILPVEAFANGTELMQQALKGLIEAGAIKRGPLPLTTPAATTTTTPPPAGSPNFS